jgi:hypothetical protein
MPTATYVIPVPLSGDGPIVAISDLVGSKTVVLTGFFSGSYSLLASHDNVEFVPVLLFNADGYESIKQTLNDAFRSVRLRSNAAPNGTVTCGISSVTKPGENLFAPLFTFVPGGSSQSPIIDTLTLFPTVLEQEINFIGSGAFVGSLLIEGSLNGANFDVIGIFQAGPLQRTLVGLPPTLEFAPLSSLNKIRYLRLTLQGQVTSPVGVTLGGRIPVSGTTGSGALTLIDEDAGRAAVENNTVVSTEVILYEVETNLASLPAHISVQLNAIVQVLIQGGVNPVGVFRVYIGATTPGDTTGSVLAVASGNIGAGPPAAISVTGAPVVNPGGACLVQLTGEMTNPAGSGTNQADIRGVTVYGS